MSGDKTEELVLVIEKHPILYDKSRKDFKDIDKKKEIWKQIAQSVGMTVKEVETRWKNVRDGLTKSRRKTKTKSGDGAQNIKEYKYAKVLAFLTPFLADRPTTSNLDKSDDETIEPRPAENEDELGMTEDNLSMSRPEIPEEAASETFVSSRSTSKKDSKCVRKRSQDEVDQTICEYLKKKASVPAKVVEKPDDVDLFLQSMAGTIRKLPARQRAEVKFKIHELVHKAEMSCLYPPAITHLPFPQTCSSYQFGPSLDMPHQQTAMYEAGVGEPTRRVSLTSSSEFDSMHYSQLQ